MRYKKWTQEYMQQTDIGTSAQRLHQHTSASLAVSSLTPIALGVFSAATPHLVDERCGADSGGYKQALQVPSCPLTLLARHLAPAQAQAVKQGQSPQANTARS